MDNFENIELKNEFIEYSVQNKLEKLKKSLLTEDELNKKILNYRKRVMVLEEYFKYIRIKLQIQENFNFAFLSTNTFSESVNKYISHIDSLGLREGTLETKVLFLMRFLVWIRNVKIKDQSQQEDKKVLSNNLGNIYHVLTLYKQDLSKKKNEKKRLKNEEKKRKSLETSCNFTIEEETAPIVQVIPKKPKNAPSNETVVTIRLEDDISKNKNSPLFKHKTSLNLVEDEDNIDILPFKTERLDFKEIKEMLNNQDSNLLKIENRIGEIGESKNLGLEYTLAEIKTTQEILHKQGFKLSFVENKISEINESRKSEMESVLNEIQKTQSLIQKQEIKISNLENKIEQNNDSRKKEMEMVMEEIKTTHSLIKNQESRLIDYENKFDKIADYLSQLFTLINNNYNNNNNNNNSNNNNNDKINNNSNNNNNNVNSGTYQVPMIPINTINFPVNTPGSIPVSSVPLNPSLKQQPVYGYYQYPPY